MRASIRAYLRTVVSGGREDCLTRGRTQKRVGGREDVGRAHFPLLLFFLPRSSHLVPFFFFRKNGNEGKGWFGWGGQKEEEEEVDDDDIGDEFRTLLRTRQSIRQVQPVIAYKVRNMLLECLCLFLLWRNLKRGTDDRPRFSARGHKNRSIKERGRQREKKGRGRKGGILSPLLFGRPLFFFRAANCCHCRCRLRSQRGRGGKGKKSFFGSRPPFSLCCPLSLPFLPFVFVHCGFLPTKNGGREKKPVSAL